MDSFIKIITGDVFNLIIDSLDARKQRVVLNGPYPSMTTFKEGVPQRSILGTLFFLILINDLSFQITIPL